jgi:hypothetical protein
MDVTPLMPRPGLSRRGCNITVDACVDTGSWFLVVNEKIRAALGLEIIGDESAALANGSETGVRINGESINGVR